MNQEIMNIEQPSVASKPDSKEARKSVKASRLSSNPINEVPNCGHASAFEVEVFNAFFRVFGANL